MLKTLKKLLYVFLLVPALLVFTACDKTPDDVITGLKVIDPEVVFDLGEEFEFDADKVQKQINESGWSDVFSTDYVIDASAYNKDVAGVYTIKVKAFEKEYSFPVLVIDETKLTIPYNTVLKDVDLGVENLSIKVTSDEQKAETMGEVDAILVYKPSATLPAIEFEVDLEIVRTNPITPSVTGLTGTYGETLSSITLPQGYTWNNLSAVMDEIGTQVFEATYTDADTEHYAPVTVNLTVEVQKATPTLADFQNLIPTNLTAVYGQTLSEIALPTGFSWMVPTTEIDDVGNITVKVKYDKDSTCYNIVENIDVTVAVSKATPTGFESSIPTLLYGYYGEPLSSVALPQGFTWADGSIIMDELSEKTYLITYTPADTAHYNSVSNINVKVLVEKATLSLDEYHELIPGEDDLLATYGQTLSEVTLPTGFAWIDPTEEINEIGQVYFEAKYDKDPTYYNTVEPILLIVNVSKATPTYVVPTGLLGKYARPLSDITLPTGFTWMDSSTNMMELGNKTFNVKYTPADTEHYNEVLNILVTVLVEKANPAYVQPTNIVGFYGETLSTVTLPSGFTWNDATAVMSEIGEMSFKATFTPADTEHYVIEDDIDITVEVSRKVASIVKATGIDELGFTDEDVLIGTIASNVATIYFENTVTMTVAEFNDFIEDVNIKFVRPYASDGHTDLATWTVGISSGAPLNNVPDAVDVYASSSKIGTYDSVTVTAYTLADSDVIYVYSLYICFNADIFADGIADQVSYRIFDLIEKYEETGAIKVEQTQNFDMSGPDGTVVYTKQETFEFNGENGFYSAILYEDDVYVGKYSEYFDFENQVVTFAWSGMDVMGVSQEPVNYKGEFTFAEYIQLHNAVFQETFTDIYEARDLEYLIFEYLYVFIDEESAGIEFMQGDALKNTFYGLVKSSGQVAEGFTDGNSYLLFNVKGEDEFYAYFPYILEVNDPLEINLSLTNASKIVTSFTMTAEDLSEYDSCEGDDAFNLVGTLLSYINADMSSSDGGNHQLAWPTDDLALWGLETLTQPGGSELSNAVSDPNYGIQIRLENVTDVQAFANQVFVLGYNLKEVLSSVRSMELASDVSECYDGYNSYKLYKKVNSSIYAVIIYDYVEYIEIQIYDYTDNFYGTLRTDVLENFGVTSMTRPGEAHVDSPSIDKNSIQFTFRNILNSEIESIAQGLHNEGFVYKMGSSSIELVEVFEFSEFDNGDSYRLYKSATHYVELKMNNYDPEDVYWTISVYYADATWFDESVTQFDISEMPYINQLNATDYGEDYLSLNKDDFATEDEILEIIEWLFNNGFICNDQGEAQTSYNDLIQTNYGSTFMAYNQDGTLSAQVSYYYEDYKDPATWRADISFRQYENNN